MGSLADRQHYDRQSYDRQGYAVIEDLIAEVELAVLRREADRVLLDADGRAGARNVLAKSEWFRRLADHGPTARVAAEILGSSARATKLTVFDKRPDANWKVPWHQDLTISVSRRADLEGFGPWTVKDGVHHVQPPLDVLTRTLAIRLHLDPTPEDNGALRVIVGSHRLGRLDANATRRLVRERDAAACPVPEGGAMLMSPLLLHMSSAAVAPSRRRVLHFEYSDVELPDPLDWA